MKKHEHHMHEAHKAMKEADKHHKLAAKAMKHPDMKEDKKLVRKMVKKEAMK